MADANTDKFFESLEKSVDRGTFVKLTLAKRRGGDSDLRNVYLRPVTLKAGARLSFLYRHRTKDVVKNHTLEEGVRLVRELLGSEFLSGHLFTLGGDLRIEFNRRRESKLTQTAATFNAPPAVAHDREKRRAVPTRESFYLRALGVTNERGDVRPAMGDKLRQINKFVEILAGLYASSSLEGRDEITVVDMGSGKGYLTFAAYDYFNNTLGVRATFKGVEARTELVKLCNETARGAGFDRLRFETGFIQEYELAHTDILVALHACDTATDDALYKGVVAGASIIIAAPCCHREVRPQIEPPAGLRGVLRHGILLEREAESVTDSLRALLLEHAGYRVKVFEFVTTEHTRKNTMVTAVRQAEPSANRETALREFRALKEFYGIREQRLEKLLCGV